MSQSSFCQNRSRSDAAEAFVPPAPPTLADIQQVARTQNTTLVEYSVVSLQGLPNLLYIWVVQPTGDIAFRQVNLDSLDTPLAQLVTQSRATLGVRSPAIVVEYLSSEELAARQTGHLQQLHQLLIEPIADLLPANPESPVVFIPHQSLFLVPFPALLNTNGEYLIQNHTILTAPSIQVLELTNSELEARNSERGEVLVVGNPTMPSIWNPDTDETQRLSNLPGAQSEAVAIAELFNTQPLLGDDATESTVTEQMSTAQIIHLATHGLLNYGIPEETGVRDFPGAIALAQGNGEDGFLTSAELLNMNLNAELVVLSACDTGRGELSSDGVIGLSRALIGAGVPNVMVSLWAVPDAPTADLMVEFYQQWQATGNKAQALRQAMLTTMETHPQPRNWAAFTIVGQE
ncbi:MAG: CHAT domain-containing protein [Cyanobacteriota bacterium]|nr:CHAT domain-containing protein [Cyanobacteriota bacterium]